MKKRAQNGGGRIELQQMEVFRRTKLISAGQNYSNRRRHKELLLQRASVRTLMKEQHLVKMQRPHQRSLKTQNASAEYYFPRTIFTCGDEILSRRINDDHWSAWLLLY